MTALVRFLLAWVFVSLVLSLLWAVACGPVDFSGDDLWPDEGEATA